MAGDLVESVGEGVERATTPGSILGLTQGLADEAVASVDSTEAVIVDTATEVVAVVMGAMLHMVATTILAMVAAPFVVALEGVVVVGVLAVIVFSLGTCMLHNLTRPTLRWLQRSWQVPLLHPMGALLLSRVVRRPIHSRMV